jgi:hypothetical protein
MPSFLRPNTIAIFATDPTGASGVASKILAFLLTNAVVVDVPGRVRFDLNKGVSATKSYDVARSPIQKIRAGNILKRPESISVQGTLSATPLGLGGALIGTFGRFVRRDLVQMEMLRKIADREEPVVLVTPARPYPSVAIKTMTEQHPGSLKVDLSMTFEEVEIVDPITIAENLALEAMLVGAGGPSNDGPQATGSVPDPGGLA